MRKLLLTASALAGMGVVQAHAAGCDQLSTCFSAPLVFSSSANNGAGGVTVTVGTTAGTVAGGDVVAANTANIAANTNGLAILNPHVARVVTGATDTLAASDAQGTVLYQSASATTVTVPFLAALDGKVITLVQEGTAQVTVAAGSGVTLVSDKASASFTTARRGAVISVLVQVTGSGTMNAFVLGNTQ